MEQSIRYGEEVIRYQVRHQALRKSTRIAIHVEPDGRVVVDAPEGAQGFLLNHVLENLEDERAGTADLYFVGFAPWSGQDVFRKDIEGE